MKISRKSRQFVILLIDILILLVSIYISQLVRYGRGPSQEEYQTLVKGMIPVLCIWLVSLYGSGMYSLEIPYTGFKMVSRIFIIAVVCTCFGFILYYLHYTSKVLPKRLLVFFSFFAFILISLWRFVFNAISIQFFPGVTVAFIGLNQTVINLIKNMDRFSYMRYQAAFIFDNTSDEKKCLGVPVLKDEKSFIQNVVQERVKLIIFSYDKAIPNLDNILFKLMAYRVYFISLSDFYETYLRCVPLAAINSLWFLGRIDLDSKNLYQYVKRFFDCIVSFIMLLLSVVFWSLIAVLIKAESPGPVFFTQSRLGYLGKEFTIIKFRTMRMDDNDQAPAKENDSRITVFGNFMRKTRIDEIPQLINVLRGEMSFIGPRPEQPKYVEELEKNIPFYRQRLFVRPGLTGWDQVSGEYHSPSVEDTYKKLQYDLYYINNMSLFLDISIVFKTIVTVFKRGGV
jgi:exopolysaccharide biosynthesis polyprenyl glycosylphosphotransferase